MPLPRTNVLFLDCHDIGDWLGCYGRPWLTTPNLDRLAAQGLVFERHVACAPICMPSRAGTYTGLMPHQVGVLGQEPLDEGASLIAARFRAAGYRTVLAGRMMVEGDPGWAGFDTVLAGEEEEAARFLAGPGAGAPFFLSLSFPLAHRPFGTDHDPEVARALDLPPGLPDRHETRADLATLARQLTELDRRVGVVLDALAAAGLAETTITVFTTEHGPALARAKHTLYEAGLRIALLLRAPGLAPARVPALTWNLDLMPTLLDLAGLPPGTGVEGRSMLPMLRRGTPGRGAVFSEHTWGRRTGAWYATPMRAIRTARHKLIRNATSGPRYVDNAWLERFADPHAVANAHFAHPVPPVQLFDLADDPGEERDLADDPDHVGLRDDLRDQLYAFLYDSGDPILDGPVPNRGGHPDRPQWVEAGGGWRLAPGEPLPAGEACLTEGERMA